MVVDSQLDRVCEDTDRHDRFDHRRLGRRRDRPAEVVRTKEERKRKMTRLRFAVAWAFASTAVACSDGMMSSATAPAAMSMMGSRAVYLDDEVKPDGTVANTGVAWRLSAQDKADLVAFLKTL